ncbi:hypothetical protein NEDG_00783 [Nematocida displodere]|uniref:Uncharacterized protein n=1 Tax=Nematocida displodere TaxID=1805483 RepID=A0A177EE22_9MICR|nr:hypothetical protein NEDG_00783 [Nematocida displodere]
MRQESLLLSRYLQLNHAQMIQVRQRHSTLYIYVESTPVLAVDLQAPILALSVGSDIFVVLGSGIQQYRYSAATNHLKQIYTLSIKGIVSSVSDSSYFLIRTENTSIKHTLYNTQALHQPQTIERAPSMQILPGVLSIRVCGSALKISYLSSTKSLNLATFALTEDRCGDFGGAQRLFIDKRNILEVDSEKIKHLVLSPQKELLALVSSDHFITQYGNAITIKTAESTYNVVPSLDYFVISSRLPPHLQQVSSVQVELEKTGTVAITRKNKLVAKILTRTLQVSATDEYVHQLLHGGTVKVFRVDKTPTLVRTLVGISTADLVSVYALSTTLSTVLALVYQKHLKVIEYACTERTKATYTHPSPNPSPSPSPRPRTPTDIQRFRKEILITHAGTLTRYSLNKQKDLIQTPITNPHPHPATTLSSHSINTPLQTVTVVRDSKYLYTGHVDGKKIVEDTHIGALHLIHLGHVYTNNTILIFSNGQKFSFLDRISLTKTYSGTNRSTVAVLLANGQLYLLNVEKDAELSSRLYQRVFPEHLEVVAINTLLLHTGKTLTVHQPVNGFLYPTLRVSFAARIISALYAQDSIYVSLEDGSISELSEKEVGSTFVSKDPERIGVV